MNTRSRSRRNLVSEQPDLRVHKSERRFECELCNMKFVRNYHKDRHVREIHGRKKRPFKCDLCSERFIRNYHKNRHIKEVHNSEKKPFECNFADCQNTYSRREALMKHEREKHSVQQPNPVSGNSIKIKTKIVVKRANSATKTPSSTRKYKNNKQNFCRSTNGSNCTDGLKFTSGQQVFVKTNNDLLTLGVIHKVCPTECVVNIENKHIKVPYENLRPWSLKTEEFSLWCIICKNSKQSKKNVIMNCEVCFRRYHQSCHEPVIKVVSQKWICKKCTNAKNSVSIKNRKSGGHSQPTTRVLDSNTDQRVVEASREQPSEKKLHEAEVTHFASEGAKSSKATQPSVSSSEAVGPCKPATPQIENTSGSKSTQQGQVSENTGRNKPGIDIDIPLRQIRIPSRFAK